MFDSFCVFVCTIGGRVHYKTNDEHNLIQEDSLPYCLATIIRFCLDLRYLKPPTSFLFSCL